MYNTKEKTNLIHPKLKKLITTSQWPFEIQIYCIQKISNTPNINELFNNYFDNIDLFKNCIPILTYHEENKDFIFIFANKDKHPKSLGEPNSLLSYFREYGYNDETLCSDCYGHLSCSACAIEITGGKIKNPTPREEEYDMLDVDESRPKTPLTRLSCQTIIGDTPLTLTIRKKDN